MYCDSLSGSVGEVRMVLDELDAFDFLELRDIEGGLEGG